MRIREEVSYVGHRISMCPLARLHVEDGAEGRPVTLVKATAINRSASYQSTTSFPQTLDERCPMNRTARCVKAFLALPLCLLLNVSPSHAAGLTFQPGFPLPRPQQLDSDPILDVIPGDTESGTPGTEYLIEVSFDTTGATNPLTSLAYEVIFDSNELFLCCASVLSPLFNASFQEIPLGRVIMSHSGGPLEPGNVLPLIQFHFIPTDNQLNSDGLADFGLENVTTNPLGAVVNVMPPIEVQPIPEPSTYAMMLAGLGVIGWIARRRRPKRGSAKSAEMCPG